MNINEFPQQVNQVISIAETILERVWKLIYQ